MRKLVTALVIASTAATASATPQDDLAFATQENGHDKVSGWVIERLVTFKLGDKCWAKILDKKNHGNALIQNYSRTIQNYARAVTGDDWAKIESQSANDKETNRALVDKMVNDFKPRFHLTVIVDGDDCDASGNAMWLKYISITTSALVATPPKSGKAFVTIHADAKARGVKTVVSSDGATFTITGSKDIEASGWPSEIEGPLKRVSAKN